MQCYSWAVVGAGPAGIAAVGKLLDHGVMLQDILWIDPYFRVGDFGALWRNIPSNTKVGLFLNFLYASDAFSFAKCDQPFPLRDLPLDETCYLGLMADPLQWITDQLKGKVVIAQDFVESLILSNRTWELKLKNKTVSAKNVILALGAEPKTLPLPGATVIPLHDVMDKNRIEHVVDADDTIAVFGSSHSAVLALQNLASYPAKKIINFYRSPLLYAVYFDDWILFDDTGLKGPTAAWAHEHLDGVLPSNLMRVYSDDESIQRYLPECTKVVYGIGFERRNLIIEGVDSLECHDKMGIIAPGLFGFGIAFPEAKVNRLGMLEYRVGLWKFMDYLQRAIPIWMKYSA